MDVKSAYKNFALGHLVEYDDVYRVVRNFISLYDACIILFDAGILGTI